MSEAFLAFLQSEPSARKVFGRRELKIVEKQLRGVNLTQSERNRLSRDVRKKLEFVRLAARFADEFGLKKGADLRRKISDALAVIRSDEAFQDVRRVWLFGSAAAGELTLVSDVDLAVEFGAKSPGEWREFRARVSGSLPDDFDLQVFNELPAKVRKEIIGKGWILYEHAD